MNGFEKALVIDAGNTRIKVAIFHFADLKDVRSFSNSELGALKDLLYSLGPLPTIIASVRSDKETKWLKRIIPGAVLFQYGIRLPISIAYETPETLGVDRIANAIAASSLTTKNALIIDFGTCVKYDVIDSNKTYLGGAISPGISLRYKAMHTFTGKLPLLSESNAIEPLGKNTHDAMQSGVMNGLMFEVKGYIDYFEKQFGELTIFLTGGDREHFEFEHKNGIFADENLTLKGLLIALIHVNS
jgi:type III pantothenate kinase